VSTVRAEAHPTSSWPRWSAAWAELAASAPNAGFFLGPSWVETWLEIFGAALRPHVVVFRRRDEQSDEIVGMCLVVYRDERRGPFPVRRAYLNTTGEDELDDTCIEYNGVLARPGSEAAVGAALGTWLLGERWDEFVANAMAAPILPEGLAKCHVTRSEISSRHVDLTTFEPTLDGFLGALSRNSREQIRRSLRLYQTAGEVRVHEAASVAEALAQLDELAALHQAAWKERGERGVFASPRFSAFHRALIARAFPVGEIRLLRVAAGQETIGVLYSFVRAGKLYFYQSGLRPSTDNKLKPGLVAHACAIAHCAGTGLREYDFLAGESQYKKSLSTASRVLTWQVFQRRSVKLAAIDVLRALRARWRQSREAASRPVLVENPGSSVRRA
jgi:CelD/BcsL family acetyltransferase involved in cellulose biosynthesis